MPLLQQQNKGALADGIARVCYFPLQLYSILLLRLLSDINMLDCDIIYNHVSTPPL